MMISNRFIPNTICFFCFDKRIPMKYYFAFGIIVLSIQFYKTNKKSPQKHLSQMYRKNELITFLNMSGV